MPVLFSATTTAQQILNSVSQDIRQTLSATDPTNGQGILLDYVDRVSKDMLRASRWMFLLSAPQNFMSQLGVSNYWIGPVGTGPSNAYDTGLNLNDLRIIKPKSVKDRTNFVNLGHTDEAPLAARLAFPDANSRPGRPKMWRQDEASPNILNIYPAPDNQSIFSPQPEAPICTTVAGGALTNRIYFVCVTFVDSFGNESTPSPATEIFIPAGFLLVVAPPQEPLIAGTTGVRYDRYNVYAQQATGQIVDLVPSTLPQQSTLNATTVSFTEPGAGLTTSAPFPPTTNSVEPISGYVMEFRYFAQRTAINDLTQTLQVPDDYRDIVIAGVNALAFDFLTRPQEAAKWDGLYHNGITKMIRDINFMSKGGEYIQPDGATIGQYLPGVESIDLAYLSN